MSMDGWGILVASFLAVLYDQVPTWYILVGLARYLYLSVCGCGSGVARKSTISHQAGHADLLPGYKCDLLL
jgi:hypothetical protein